MADKKDLQRQLQETRGFPAINEETTRQALRAFLWSGLPLATVATFDRQQLPQLALARIPGVASRFHTVLGRFGLPPGALAAPTAPAPAPMDPAALTAVVASAGSTTSGAEDTNTVPSPPPSPGALASEAGRNVLLQLMENSLGKKVSLRLSLQQQGMDSMMSIDLSENILRQTSQEVPQHKLLEDQPLSVLLGEIFPN
ncbi:unnamed protein product [Effrenium voratum]|nr:unnamed protein product [Effrenium voratum]